MRRLDDTPLDPDIEATLDAIDATLAGEPVDPQFAEIAELALMLADERPRPRPEFAALLDARVERRFAPEPTTPGQFSAPARRRRRWSWGGAAGGLATACAGVLVALVVVLGGSGGGSSNSYSAGTMSSASTSSASGAPGGVYAPAAQTPNSSESTAAASAASGAHRSPNAQTKSVGTNQLFYASPSQNLDSLRSAPSPTTNGRVIVQSAELDLGAAPNHIDSVAQEVFTVVGAAGGIVDHSSITQTGGTDGYANFQLRIPSTALAQTLGRLSQLSGATVVARTDNTQDVNDSWISAHRKLADDRALRAALLKQLANATTTGEIDSLNARIHDAEGAIAADEGAINSLSARINYSRVVVNVNARPVPLPLQRHHSSGGFTLGHSAHIAGRVLVVAAGVALIALAGLVPVGLLAALGTWIAVTVRRRRREQALDMA